MDRSASDVLKQYWKFDFFRPQQEEIIQSVLAGNDTLALFPTGGGKSLCFQVPTLMREGICLVISPLIALMKDQVQNLRKKGITAFAIYSGMSRKDVISTFKLAATSNCRFLYVSPERLESDLFQEYLPSLKIKLVAIDEAHCISQWGYDFRPSYLRIAEIRDNLPGVPILALTASATPLIQKDICDRLKMNEAKIFRQSFSRPNLSFSVHHATSIINKILEILRRLEGSAIIYCKNRRRTKEISDTLLMHGITADFYHAGLMQDERNDRQERWMKNEIRVIVCTNAFGMGIDKPDVRLVIHADVPENLENYYQEAGRAGRDGQRSYAVLLCNRKMLDDLEQLHAQQYPTLEYIRTIYQSLSNYLQVPLGTEDVTYSFDLPDFLKKFMFQRKPAKASLQVLQQEGYMELNETVFQPSSLQFVCDKVDLFAFENANPALEPVIKTLLRTYAGIFDQPVNIHEKTLALILNSSLEKITNDIQHLQRFGIVKYSPQKETPQIYYGMPRRKSTDVRIDEKAYHFKKEQFLLRVKGMLEYTNTTICRSVAISTYFGMPATDICGICDNCVKKAKEKLSTDEFQRIYQKLKKEANTQSITATQLFDQFTDIYAGHLKKVIDYMQAENKMTVDSNGYIHIR